jgi:hypothetical protein
MIFELIDLQKEKKKKKFDQKSFKLNDAIKETFNQLKKTFTTIFTLIYFDLVKKILLKTNVLRFALSEILSQLIEKTDR